MKKIKNNQSLVLFEEDLTKLINKYSLENISDVPDHILASYLVSCLAIFCLEVENNNKWHGHIRTGSSLPTK